MSEDYSRNCKCKHTVEQMVLKNIRDILQSMGKEIQSFPLPEIDEQHDTTDDVPREMTEELSIEVNVEDRSLHGSLNKEQRAAYDEILATIDSKRGGIFFVDGPGGTGKTFLYRALLATIRGQGKIALATATSGVAASIMPGGRTAHSRFKIPLRIDEGAICGFTKQSRTAKLLQVASLIIWDEASMTKRQAVEALDRSMRDIMDRPDLLFGGKTVVFGGDFRQVLPVVRKGTRAQIVDASLTRSDLWKCMRQMKLVRNMRARNDPWFAEYLLHIGNGTEKTNEGGEILLPTSICVPNNHNGLDKLIDHIYRTPGSSLEDPKYITSRAILATKNDCVDKINLKMIDRFQGEEMVYYSFDSVEEDPYGYYPEDFLNNLTPNGLPPHMLKLKINCPIILLRNIDPANGLCNGTRLVVRGFHKNAIDAEIVLGQHSGMRVFLPRIPLCPSDEEMFPFRFKRKQFPVRLSFAMTINKSQGQTIPNVGIYLPKPVFSHGQLYVALSRATATSNIKVLIGTCEEENENTKEEKKKVNQKKNKKMEISTSETYTKNIVHTEVLTK
ncbi:ATP-dependent DNA helicase PIF1-like [Lolium rigidum]|uniref:ATP-dependent DNA helicase PIF1-like n=1 Tax=Lolium rigidum TaxID=89674 RepID=UPI001F5DED44|nr:ATP-dependent DNA helicase PIF1-like [Lolium rigidum]